MDKINFRRSELEELQYQASQITDESLDSTRRMLSMMEESKEAGRRTIETLDIQGEQLHRIEQGMDYINADMTKAERSLSRLKRCCNFCKIPCKKDPTLDELDMNRKYDTEKNYKIIVNQPLVENRIKSSNIGVSENFPNGYIKRITNDAREDEMESNLCKVNSILGSLQNMAVDMNAELSKQNGEIERINTKGNANAIRLDHVNTSANDLLNG